VHAHYFIVRNPDKTLSSNQFEIRSIWNTDLIPKTFFSVNEWLENSKKYKDVIFRPVRHAQGRHLLKVNVDEYKANKTKVNAFIAKHPEYYINHN
jgi:hypothetical protein